MIDAADGLGIAPAIVAIGGNFKHGPAWLGPLRPAAQPPGSPAAAELTAGKNMQSSYIIKKNIKPTCGNTHGAVVESPP